MEDLIKWLIADGHGYPVIFLLLLGAGLGIPIPEDVPLLATGVLATSENGLSVVEGASACALFVLTRDLIVYGLGRRYGTGLLKRRLFRRIAPEETVHRYQALIRQRAVAVVFIGRFAVGLRSAIFFAAGTAGVSVRLFLLVDAVAALVSVPFFVWLGYHLADQLGRVETITKDIRLVSLVLLGLLLAVALARGFKRRLDAAADQANREQESLDSEAAGPPGETSS